MSGTALPLPAVATALPLPLSAYAFALPATALPLHCNATALPGTALQGPSLPKMEVLDTRPTYMTAGGHMSGFATS